MASYKLDEIDRKILYYLVNNARMPYMEIARECGISGAAVHQRIKKMEEGGVIIGSQMMVKPGTLGLNVCAFINITLAEDNKYPEVIDALRHVSEIVECHFVTGRSALLLKVYCIDNDHLMETIINTIQRIPYVQSTETMISLDQAFERQVWVKDFKSTTFRNL
ncbi:MAG: Lrp/AsnC ligand binding domain-containing protein [Bacteroidales bacterium]|nr:Lrp/AsnC ligand binding domain-containing protein [Bacteroidales bacterium]